VFLILFPYNDKCDTFEEEVSMSILRWNPMENLDSLREDLSRLMHEGMAPLRTIGIGRSGERPMRLALDAYTTDEEIVITAAVPGLEPEDIEITMEGETLTIKGQFPEPLENVDYLFRERPRGTFSRTLTVNAPIVVEEAEAKFDKGVLMLILPRSPEACKKVITITSEKTES
jgi:HSP20 family protein